MNKSARILFGLTLAAALTGAVGAAAEVKIAPPAGDTAGDRAGRPGPALVVDGTVGLQCWQGGVAVFEASRLSEAAVVPLLPATVPAAAGGAVGLKARDAGGAVITLVPLGESLCLIRGQQ